MSLAETETTVTTENPTTTRECESCDRNSPCTHTRRTGSGEADLCCRCAGICDFSGACGECYELLEECPRCKRSELLEKNSDFTDDLCLKCQREELSAWEREAAGSED